MGKQKDNRALAGPVVALSLVALAMSAVPAMAAGGAVPELVRDIGASLFVAGGIAVLFARLRIPSIAAFILGGILLGPQGLHVITDSGTIDAIAQIGFVLLLFVIGLEIDVRSLLASGRSLLVAAAIQYPLTLLFGFVIAKLIVLAGLGGLLGESSLAPLYFGIAIAGSSSLLVVKLFQEHFQLDTQPGRIALTVLIFQDIWAIIVVLIQPSLDSPDIVAIAFSFLGISILIGIATVLSRVVIGHAFSWIAKSPELILLGAMSWCFALVAIGTNLDALTEVFGFNLHMSVGSGMAALIAGATIASLPFSTEIVTKVSLVKDFFITLFFVGLGITMPAITSFEIPLLALFLGVVAIIARQLVFFPLFYALGIDQRNAQVSSVQLAQVSEFALVISFLGVQLGHISHEVNSVIILAFVLTAILTTPLFERAYAIHERFKGALTRLGFREPGASEEEGGERIDLMVLGIHRDASSFLTELAKAYPEVLPKTVVVDFNVAIHSRVRELGIKVKYGDLANEESLIHAGADKARIFVCTIPDDLLRGINNQELARMLRRINPTATIISNAIEMKRADAVKEAGADVVYMPRLEVARGVLDAFAHAYEDRVEAFVDKQHETFGHYGSRNEIMN